MPQSPDPAVPEPRYPAYPAAPEPQYPQCPEYPEYPEYPAAPEPQYPEAAQPPCPTAPEPPHPPYPTATEPRYPTAPEPSYPQAAEPPYPVPEPRYPEAAEPPHPQPRRPQFPYPQPPYPQPPYPHHPAAPFPDPPNVAQPPPRPAPAGAVDDLDYRHLGSRIHVAARQRGADATAVGRLVVHLPGFAVSFLVVASLALGILGNTGWLVVLGWLASGALAFHRPTELAFARHVLGLREPLAEERARLAPVWREVTARAGIEGHTYELMVENSDDLNALAAAGHVVGVTTYSLNTLPSSKLGAVLAHELGHHTNGHSWAGLLGHWYSLPGRVVWNLARRVTRVALHVASRVSLLATGVVFLCLGGLVLATAATLWFVVVPLLAVPYLLACLGRRAELRADQQAAALGFAPMLADVLRDMQAREAAGRSPAAGAGRRAAQPGRLAHLLSSHPDHSTRLRALEPHLRQTR